jgi:hypothetical protein
MEQIIAGFILAIVALVVSDLLDRRRQNHD